LQELCNSDDVEKEKQVKEIKKVIREHGEQAATLFSPSDLEALTNYPNVLAPKKFGAYEMADKGGMLEYYQSIYRELSRQGAHATVSALDYAAASPVGTLRFAPVADESTVSVLSHTDTCLRLCIDLITTMAAASPQSGS
jgi:Xaa-Pro aminopeptidase